MVAQKASFKVRIFIGILLPCISLASLTSLNLTFLNYKMEVSASPVVWIKGDPMALLFVYKRPYRY